MSGRLKVQNLNPWRFEPTTTLLIDIAKSAIARPTELLPLTVLSVLVTRNIRGR